MTSTTTKMTPGDEIHLTLLMAPYSLNFFTGQDRQHLLAYGRAAFEAGLKIADAAEQAAWHAGLDEGRAQKSCLVQIQEPAVNQQLTTEQEPVTWLLRRSAFRASPDGQDAEGHEWLEEADEPGQESSFPVYAAPVLAAQPAKSLMKRVDAAAEAMSEVMAHVNLGAWSVKFERALAGLRAVQETEPQAAPAAIDGGHHVDG